MNTPVVYNFIILNLDIEITDKNLEYFNQLVDQRAKGKPIAYLTEKKSFWKTRNFSRG